MIVEQILYDLLLKYFGFSSFRPGQGSIVQAAFSGQDILAVMPTGAGKSLTYQLPALAADGLTLVVSPLIALMKDQVDALTDKGIPAAMLNSSQSRTQQQAVEAHLAHLKLLFISPERLQQPSLQHRLQTLGIARLVVDEAHCISEWGHDFRPDFRKLASVRAMLGQPPVTALTATATAQVKADIKQSLALQQAFEICTGFDRPNLSYRVWQVACEAAKAAMMRSFLATQETPGILYASTRKATEHLAQELCALGYRADYYHGARLTSERQSVQDAFLNDQLDIIVATSAFGMGIDKPNVRFVLHMQPPATLESYYQEAGRAGRDGQEAVCVLLYSADDEHLQRAMLLRSLPSVMDLKRFFLWLRQRQCAVTTKLSTLEQELRLGRGKLERIIDVLTGARIISSSMPHGDIRLEIERAYRSSLPVFPQQALQVRYQERLAQLRALLNYAQKPHCRKRALLDYFGDHTPLLAACRCDTCTPEGAALLTKDGQLLLELCQSYRLSRVQTAALLHGDAILHLAAMRSPYRAYFKTWEPSAISRHIQLHIEAGFLKDSKTLRVKPGFRQTQDASKTATSTGHQQSGT